MKEINIRDIKISPVELINDGWGLVTAGTPDSFNTMTVSWGALGEIWSKDAVFAFIRLNRYTYEFLEKDSLFTLSFYDKKYHSALAFCGSKSGRDYDKPKETGLTPVAIDGAVTFEQAKYTIVCKKVASQIITPDSFIAPEIASNYKPDGSDLHKMYIGEIIKVYEN